MSKLLLEVADQIVDAVGGKENITANAVCMTRLHVSVVDESKINYAVIKKIDGVLGVVEGKTVQIVFGPGKVNKVGEVFSKATGIILGEEEVNIKDIAKQNKKANDAKQTHPVQVFFKHFANIFLPLLPGIAAAGLINGVTKVINFQNGGALVGEWWYAAIMTLGWALFFYLPIFVGMNATKEFKGSAILGGIGGALCVSVSGMPLLAKINDANILLPITNQAFNPASGGILAALFTGIFIAYTERFVRKFVPDVLDTFLTPLITILVTLFAALFVIQPFGTLLTGIILGAAEFLYGTMGFIGAFVLAVVQLPLVSVGLHRAFTPIHAMLNNPEGPSLGVNYLLPILMMAGGGQVGTALALYVKTKNKNLKKAISASVPAGVLGIGEPLMYGVTLPLLRPFITACIGSGFGGAVAAILNVGTISQGVSGLLGLLIVNPGYQFQYVIGMVVAYAAGFTITWFFGYDEKKVEEIFN